MRMRRRLRVGVLALTVGLAAGALFRGPGEAALPDPDRRRVAVVLSVGGLGDRSFNDMAYEGLVRARDELGVVTVYGEPASMSEDERYLEFYAEEGFDLVFAIGFLMKSALARVAERHPGTKFAIIDDVVERDNVASVTFREHEGSYLVGVLAARKSKSGVVGAVLGLDVELLWKFQYGFEQGFLAERHRTGREGRVLTSIVGSFADPVAGKQKTRLQIQEGADVVYQAAGQSGNGVIAAAHEAGVHAIGVDSNQNGERPGTVLTSMLKKVDVAVFELCRDLVEGNFAGGVHTLGVADGGVGWALDEHNRALVTPEDEARLAEVTREIIEGRLVVEPLPPGKKR